MNSTTEQFKLAIAAAGMTPPDTVEPGRIHRFPGAGKGRGNTAGRCFMFADMRGGWYEDYSSGMGQVNWQASGSKPYSQAEKQANIERSRAANQAYKAEKDQARTAAAVEAEKRFNAASECTQHAYLTTKGVQPHGIRLEGDKLLIPMRETAGKLRSLQTIAPDGGKRFLKDGEVTGCYHAIGNPTDKLIITEGYATGASVHQATGDGVAVAFNAGNLEPVALALRAKYPALKIIIAADDDYRTAGNPGVSAAKEAALAVGGFLAVPDFGADRPDGATDFNDLHQLAGVDAVNRCIEGTTEFIAADARIDSASRVNGEDIDNHRNAPRPSADCLHGLIGDVARAGSATTEANPYAIAANFIAFMGCAVGRGPFMSVGNTWHHARQFTLHIGRSGRGRKGDATSLVSRIERALRSLDADATPQVHRGGLSSREGLVFLIHDGYSEGKNEVEAIADKRLVVIESEFANILMQSKRDGNTLSSALRDCWDGVSLKPATKTSRLWATDPHLSLAAAITPGELHSLMASRELTNGFANRFLMFWAEKTKSLAFPVATPQTEVDALAVRVLKVLEFCNATRWVEKDNMRVSLSPDARKRYEGLYHGELNDNSAGERITALIERRAPMLLRLAMLFALCDLTTTVEMHHINAALAWVRYSVDSVKFIFASAADEIATAATNDTAQKIVEFLKVRTTATRWELSKNCFGGHASKGVMDGALDELLSCNPPLVTVELVPRQKGSPGNATKTYRLTDARPAKSAESEYSCGLAGDLDGREVSEVLRSDPTADSLVTPDFADLADLAEHQNQPLGRMDIETSHIPHTSHADADIFSDSEEF